VEEKNEFRGKISIFMLPFPQDKVQWVDLKIFLKISNDFLFTPLFFFQGKRKDVFSLFNNLFLKQSLSISYITQIFK